MKKLGLLFAVVVMSLMFAVSVSALEPTGQCGDNVYWEYDQSTGELIISGEGAMWNYNQFSGSPFSCDNIKNIIIKDQITSIGAYAFYKSPHITVIAVPESVTSIGEGAFLGCTELRDIVVDEKSIVYSTDSFGVLFNKNKTVLIHYPNGRHKLSYSIPNSVEIVDSYAFAYSDIETIDFGNSITTIKNRAFMYCNKLINVVLPYAVENIGDGAFQYCTGLSAITLPDSLMNIGYDAFDYCSRLTYVYYNGSKEEWKDVNIGSGNNELTNAKINYHIHIYASEIKVVPTHLSKGIETFTCSCGKYYVESVDEIEEHTYAAVITDPTCTEKGYTTYVCECNESYVSDYVESKEHSFSDKWTVDIEATCTSYGSKSHHCIRCDEKTDVMQMGKLAHCYNMTTINPTCVDRGYNAYICYCGDNYTETIPATGHNIVGSACTECDYDKSFDCSCNCHKSGIPHLIFKIILFFQKLFGQNKVCACGVKH